MIITFLKPNVLNMLVWAYDELFVMALVIISTSLLAEYLVARRLMIGKQVLSTNRRHWLHYLPLNGDLYFSETWIALCFTGLRLATLIGVAVLTLGVNTEQVSERGILVNFKTEMFNSSFRQMNNQDTKDVMLYAMRACTETTATKVIYYRAYFNSQTGDSSCYRDKYRTRDKHLEIIWKDATKGTQEMNFTVIHKNRSLETVNRVKTKQHIMKMFRVNETTVEVRKTAFGKRAVRNREIGRPNVLRINILNYTPHVISRADQLVDDQCWNTLPILSLAQSYANHVISRARFEEIAGSRDPKTVGTISHALIIVLCAISLANIVVIGIVLLLRRQIPINVRLNSIQGISSLFENVEKHSSVENYASRENRCLVYGHGDLHSTSLANSSAT